jgi:hypothetical protein
MQSPNHVWIPTTILSIHGLLSLIVYAGSWLSFYMSMPRCR